MLHRLLLISGLVLWSSTAAAQTMSEGGWTQLYSQNVAANTSAVAIGPTGIVYWGSLDDPSTIRSRTLKGRLTTLHFTEVMTGIAARGTQVFFTSTSLDSMQVVTPGLVPQGFGTGLTNPAGIEVVPTGWTTTTVNGASVAAGDFLVVNSSDNGQVYRVPTAGGAGAVIGATQNTYDGLVDVAATTTAIYVIDRADPDLFRINNADGDDVIQTVTPAFTGDPVGIEWDRTNNTLIVALVNGGPDTLVRLTSTGTDTWSSTIIGTGFAFDDNASQVLDISADGTILVVAQDNNIRAFARCALQAATDCNNNDVADVCDVIAGNAIDCNDNMNPDVCDISQQVSTDCDGNNQPDECAPCSAPVDMVFVVDSSGSMDDEAESICDNITDIIAELQAEGITVFPTLYAIGLEADAPYTANASYNCLTNYVGAALGTDVPGAPPNSTGGFDQNELYNGCGDANSSSREEDWGRATSVVAGRFAWGAGRIRLIVGVTDELPWCGTQPENAQNAADTDSVTWAINTSLSNNANVAMILANNYDATAGTEQLAVNLASGTGGSVSRELAGPELVEAIKNIVRDQCVEESDCDNNGQPDLCDINGGADDCDNNDRLDICDGTVCNTPPIANPDTGSTLAGVPVTLSPAITANDTDAETSVVPSTVDLNPNVAGDQKTLTVANGTWTVTNNGLVTYTPAAGFTNATAEIQYVVDDTQNAQSNLATISVVVRECQDTAGPGGIDNGCDVDFPVCDTTNPNAPICVECEVDADCPADEVCTDEGICVECELDADCPAGEVCTDDNTCVDCEDTVAFPGIDAGCVISDPVCDDRVAGQEECKPCYDSTPGAGVDDGCVVAEPICNEDGGVNEDGDCVRCLDNNPGDGIDLGCSILTPFCLDDVIADDPTCVECLTDDDCEGEEVCEDGTCVDIGKTTALPDSYRTNINVTLTVNAATGVMANDLLPIGTTATVTTLTTPLPAQGMLTLNADGSFTFVPAVAFVGTVTFGYRLTNAVTDGFSDTLVTLIVSGPPGANPDNETTPEDTPITFDPLENDTDPNSDALEITEVGDPPNGTVTINEDGTVTYMPDPNYNGTDVTSYTVCDIGDLCTQGTITIVVTPVNDLPIVKDDLATTPEDTPVLVVVLSNDVEVDGEELEVTQIVTAASNGTTEIKPDGTVLYTPRLNFVGRDAFAYEACDESNTCSTANVIIDVTAVNDGPVAGDDAVSTKEDTEIVIPVLANDSDVDGDDLVIRRIVFQPQGGDADITGDDVTYTPDDGKTGTDTFIYEVCDEDGVCDQATVTVTVGLDNEAPDLDNDSVTTPIGTPAIIDVTANDSDPDGDPITVTQVGVPPNGGAVITPGGDVVYTPSPGFTGTDVFTYTACDDNGACATATITVTVEAGANRPPIATDDIVNTVVNTPVTFDPTDNDLDPDGDDLTVGAIITPAGHGTVTLVTGGVSYTPAEGFLGTDVFEVRVDDGNGGSDTSIVTVVVTAVPNRPPDAVDDSFEVSASDPTPLDVLVNDTDADGDDLVIVDVVQPSKGYVAVLAVGGATAPGITNGKLLELQPYPGAAGSDVFSYTISDGRGGFDSAFVTIVFPVLNAPPDAIGDIVTTPEDVAVLIVVTSNDTDPEGQPLTITTIVEPPRHGTATIEFGAVLYTPDPDYNGPDTFVYSVCDPENACDSAGVSLTVLPVNDGPDAEDDFFSVPSGQSSDLDVTPNDTDPEGDDVEVTAITVPASNGEVFINDDGTITYEPGADFIGSDTFEYEVCDPFDACDTAVVTVFVGDGNGNPTPQDDTAETTEGTPVSIDVIDNDTDPDGDPLEVGTVSDPPHGTTEIDDSEIIYTPDTDFTGEDTFCYTACDTNNACATACVTVMVEDTSNQPPVAVDDTFQTREDTAITFDTRLNDFDFDGDDIQPISNSEPTHGEARINQDGTITYVPDAGFVGNDTFTVTVTDGRGGESTQNVLIIVLEGANEPPDAIDDFYNVPSDGTSVLRVRDNDLDPDNDPLIIIDVEQPVHATVVVDEDSGDLIIDPEGTYIGPDVFCYTISDQNGGFDSACVDIVIGDRDGDRIGDGAEDEITGTDPDDPDTDGDGINDGDEIEDDGIYEYDPGEDTDPLDADTDDDGLNDGDEVNGSGPLEDHGPSDPLDPDTDNDDIQDGTELGVDSPIDPGVSEEGVPYVGTDPDIFIPDEDPETTTDPLDDDTDDDGITDGTEDVNHNGAWEGDIGVTGTPGEGESDPLNEDTDGDGIQDGTELGLTEPGGVNTDLNLFLPDLDPETTTDPLDKDSDDGGVDDGVEDPNFNGFVDPGEIDPNFGDDDIPDTASEFVAEGGGCASGSDVGLLGLVLLALAVLSRKRRIAFGCRAGGRQV